MEKKYYYKAMDKDMKCWEDFQFEVGKTYTIDSKELKLFSDKVFHFCEKLEDTIEYYAGSSERHFLIEVLGNIITDVETSGSNKIRIVKEISRKEIEEHIKDKYSYNAEIFLALYSPNIKTLERLSKDKKWEVRESVAENLNTPVYILEILSKDKDWEVRYSVADNLNTPAHILEELVKDKDEYVREKAQERLKEITQ